MIDWKKLTVVFFLFTALLPLSAQADEVADLKKKLMMDQKKLIVMENMTLTEEEAKHFWSGFEKLQEDLFVINQRLANLIVAYAASYQNLTDEQAQKIIAEFFEIQKDRSAKLEKHIQELGKKIPWKKVFRYLQIENKLDNIARYELSKSIPLAQ